MRISAFKIEFDAINLEQAVRRVLGWAKSGNRLHYVVTPNVNHIVKLQNDKKFRSAYNEAALILTDGKPVYIALRMLGKPVPETVTGSDFVPKLFGSVKKTNSLKVFLLGAAPGVAERAAEMIENRWPTVKVVGYYSPPIGFEADKLENQKILAIIDESKPEVLVIGLGAPKQELWAFSHMDKINAKVALCVGATIDFLAGNKKRAPKWMQAVSCEWIYRILLEPRRLTKRYFYDGLIFPYLVLKELLQEGYRHFIKK